MPYFLILVLGVAARLYLAQRASGYDVESWLLIAQKMQAGEPLYSSLERYNYGPIWAYVLWGIKATADFFVGGPSSLATFHVALSAFLTLVDVALAGALAVAYGIIPAVLYFSCPVSIILSGLQGQFENFALLFGFASWLILRSPERRARPAEFYAAALLLGISITTKHVLAFWPFWILAWKPAGRFSRRAAFVGISLGVFGLSFVPWLVDADSRHWVWKSVFAYNSFPENALALKLAGLFAPKISLTWIKALWVAGVLAIGYSAARGKRPESVDLFSLYLLAFFALAPGARDEYLAIPLLAVVVNYARPLSLFYVLFSTIFLFGSPVNFGWIRTGIAEYHLQAILLALIPAILAGDSPEISATKGIFSPLNPKNWYQRDRV